MRNHILKGRNLRRLVLIAVLAASSAAAQDSSPSASAPEDNNVAPAHWSWPRLQFHGTLTQAFAYGSGNNYLTLDSTHGSGKWSEGALNVSTNFTDNFHAGIQLHSYIIGQIGRGNVDVDWAYGDYRIHNWVGIRAGKLKSPMGIYNEIQDTDTLYNWILLPQSIYEAEFRSYNVPYVGGSLYGRIALPAGGALSYQVFGGKRSIDGVDGGPLLSWQLYGISQGEMAGYTYGADLKWETPIDGLTLGATIANSRVFAAHGFWPINPYGVPLALQIDATTREHAGSIQFQRGKFEFDAEGKHEPHWLANNGIAFETSPRNGWYVMGLYRPTSKLTFGSYFSRVFGTSYNATFRWVHYDPSKPEFYGDDTVVNGRYDINRFCFAKLEAHYINGELGAFFPGTNPNGLQKITRLAIGRVGFTF